MLSNSLRLAALCVLTAVGPVYAANEVTVVITRTSGGGCGSSQSYTVNAATDFTITGIDDCVTQIKIYVNVSPPALPSDFNIGRVTISGSVSNNSTGDFNVVIGPANFTGADSPFSTVACYDWKGITFSDTNLRDHCHLEGRIAHNLTTSGVTASVAVGHLYRFEVDGSIQAPVTAQVSSDSTAFFGINCGGIAGPGDAAAGSIRSFNGDIRRVKATGAIRGSIDADSGSILQIETGTANGSDGNLEGNVTASGDLQNVLIAGRILGSIIDVGGDLIGQLNADEICCASTAALNIGGNIAADITIETSIIAPVTINGNLLSGHRITLKNGLSAQGAQFWIKEANGLQGEIIMNADNTSPNNQWNKDIKIGTTSPIILGGQQSGSTPYYSQTSSALGGGAVGLAPFHLHDTDCDPVNGGTISGGFNAPGQVELRFYGPIRQTPSTTYPVQIRYYDGSWHTIPGNEFSYSFSGRSLTITALTSLDFDSEVTYEITPTNLQCVGVTNNPSVASFTYTIMAE
ncbi:MAG: hypothetical protein ACKVW3_14520 [Phycisphaerales bacterium]